VGRSDPGSLVPAGRDVLGLSAREGLAVLLGVVGLLIAVPMLGGRDRVSVVEPDYRIPYSLSHRYRLYRQYTTLSSLQYPALVIGDSVVWGQCALRNRTLSHYLNEQMQAPRFANAGLDAMHPIALESLIEFHAPSVKNKSILLHFNPLWFMSQEEAPATAADPLRNRPNLVPRLASGSLRDRTLLAEAAWSRILRAGPWSHWVERTLEHQMDFLAWSITHPYESPLSVLASSLPPSEDTFSPRLLPWNAGTGGAGTQCTWPVPGGHEQWQAFERLIDRLDSRGNRLLVLVGPLNEHMLTPQARDAYHRFTAAVGERLRSRGTAFYMPPPLASRRYGDICHPLADGYEELAQLLLRDRPEWFAETRLSSR